ncbi:DUF1697 domain-containing protein [uncultured Lacinutrix sp.]|uniref:DUF1697 domain-containing protein n=1 Tax=uncultured Lacinutrix sp. TaxID=574032 RepID=UPI002629707D|nr:DUF1697 domain-containing protein [uncultured Lacinutrix sp.]
MNTYVALLRGINVGGHKKTPMAALRQLLTDLQFENVKTYIQSGNIVFNSIEKEPVVLENKISEAIKKYFGFEVPTLVKTKEEFESIFNNCPFTDEKKQQSYFTLLQSVPKKELLYFIEELNYPDEEIVPTNRCIYFFSDKPYGNVKYNNNLIERKLKVSATSRNYKTMKRLLELL